MLGKNLNITRGQAMKPSNELVNFGTYLAPTTSVTANANFNSLAIWATAILRISFQAVVTGGTATGNLQMQVSNDKPKGVPPGQFQPTNWSNLGSTVAVSGAGTYLIPYVETSYQYIRIQYIDGSSGTGTGTLAITLESKGL